MLNIAINNNKALTSAEWSKEFDGNLLINIDNAIKEGANKLAKRFGGSQTNTAESNDTMRLFAPYSKDKEDNLLEPTKLGDAYEERSNLLKHLLSPYYSEAELGEAFDLDACTKGINLENVDEFEDIFKTEKNFKKMIENVSKIFVEMLNKAESASVALRIKLVRQGRKKSYVAFPDSGWGNVYKTESGSGVIESMDVPEDQSKLFYTMREKGYQPVKIENSATGKKETLKDENGKTVYEVNEKGFDKTWDGKYDPEVGEIGLAKPLTEEKPAEETSAVDDLV